MSRYPGAVWRPLKENSTEPLIKPTQLILHSAVSKADSLFAFFNRDDVVVESHFYVQDDGDVEQYIDTGRQADANYKANVRAISIETWDNRNPDKVIWNDDQLRAMAEIAAWAHIEHGIPLRRSRFATDPGVGGHTDWPDWSNVRGKTCPGVVRKRQIQTVIDMARAIVNATTSGDFIMDKTTENQMRTLLQTELRTVLGERNLERKDTDPAHVSLSDLYTQQERFEAAIDTRLTALENVIAGGDVVSEDPPV